MLSDTNMKFELFVEFRDPQLCEFDNMLLFDFVSVTYFFSEGRELNNNFLIQIFILNIHSRMMYSSIRLEQTNKQIKIKRSLEHQSWLNGDNELRNTL